MILDRMVAAYFIRCMLYPLTHSTRCNTVNTQSVKI